MDTPEKDDFTIRSKRIITLFNLLRDNKDTQFIDYISNLKPEDIDINIKDTNGNHMIFMAVIKDKIEIVTILIKYGARLDIIDTEGYSLLFYPIRINNRNMIDILLVSNKENIGLSLVNICDSKQRVPLFYAAKYKNHYAIEQLLKYGADPNHKNNSGLNVLHMAVLRKDINIVKSILVCIKNIDARTNNGSTALHYSCSFQLLEITKLLLEAGANTDLSEFENDMCPIFYTVIMNDLELTKLLIDYRASPNYQDYLGNTMIHYVILNKHMQILDYIFKKYPIKIPTKKRTENINDQNTDYNIYIDCNIVNIDGLTIMHLLLYDYRPDFLAYITKILPYANINCQDNAGNTLLHIIAEKGLCKVLEPFIINKKMHVYIKNSKGKTVIDLVNLSNKDSFIETIVHSYYSILTNNKNEWQFDWQNSCSNIGKSDQDYNKCIKYIKNDILENKVSVPIIKSKEYIIIQQHENIQFSTFSGSLLDILCGFRYLELKYPYVCTILHKDRDHDNDELQKYHGSLGILDNPHRHIVYFEIRWIYQQIFFPSHFRTLFKDAIISGKYKYIILPIGIILSNGHHSNALLYDIETHTIERFEPHGSNYPSQFNYNPELLDDTIYRKFAEIISSIYGAKISITYYNPKKYLPRIGFQTFENTEVTGNKNIGDPNGFCALWCIWYLDYRLKYHKYRPDTIVRKMIKRIRISNYSFRTLIRNYSEIITSFRDSYLKTISKTINDYLNNRLTDGDIADLYNTIIAGR